MVSLFERRISNCESRMTRVFKIDTCRTGIQFAGELPLGAARPQATPC